MIAEYKTRVLAEIERIGHWPRFEMVRQALDKIEADMAKEATSLTAAIGQDLEAAGIKALGVVVTDVEVSALDALSNLTAVTSTSLPAISTTELEALNTTQLGSLTSTEVASLSSAQVDALTSPAATVQLGGLTSTEISALDTGSK